MSILPKLTLHIAATGTLLFSTTVLAATNTNECIADLGGIQACQDTGWLGLPEDLWGCCDGVRELAVDRCECSPALDLLLGEEGQQIYDLEPLCRFIQWGKWHHITPRPFRSCSSLETNDYGCEANDMEVDAARLSSVLGLGAISQGLGENACFDTPATTEQLKTVLEHDARVTVPYGAGTYVGEQNIAEYLGLTAVNLTHGFFLNLGSDPTKPARLEVSEDGSVWTAGSTSAAAFADGELLFTDLYIETQSTFDGCEGRMSNYEVLPTEGIRTLIENFVWASDLSQRWGVEDICRYHTEYCANDPSTRQYANEAECLEYLGQLPLYTEACGPNRPLAGHSIGCKLKHHFMIPTNPALHCPHIGPLGSTDPSGHLKCDDVTECSADQGQDTWPPIVTYGQNMPEDVVEAYLENNVGYEDEEFACVVPSLPQEH